MKNEKLVSIAMCTYNGEKFLKEQLDSILAQSYKNIELIITDDCSTDRTINILDQYQKSDSRIKLFQNEKNLGFTKNFEKAISLCSGDFIALSDQDDIWKLNKIEKFVEEIGINILIYSDATLIDHMSKEIGKELIRNANNLCKGHCNRAFLLNNFVSGNTLMFNKSLTKYILPIPEKISYHDIWIAFVSSTYGTITYTDESMTYYRRYPEQVTHSEKVRHKSFIKKQRYKKQELIERYQIRANDLESFLSLAILKNKETVNIIENLIWQFRNHTHIYFNKKLYSLLKKYDTDIFESMKKENRNKFIRRYSIGLKLRILAFFKI